MNTFQEIKALHDYLNLVEHWLSDEFANPKVLSNISTRIQEYADKLKTLDLERTKELQDNGPMISGQPGGITVSLLRPDETGALKERHIEINEYNVQLGKTDQDDKIKSLYLIGPPDADGMTHFMQVCPGDRSKEPWGFWISKEESDKLNEKLAIVYADEREDEDYWREDYKCTFCGSMASECGEDHGDEMRDIMRAHRERHW